MSLKRDHRIFLDRLRRQHDVGEQLRGHEVTLARVREQIMFDPEESLPLEERILTHRMDKTRKALGIKNKTSNAREQEILVSFQEYLEEQPQTPEIEYFTYLVDNLFRKFEAEALNDTQPS